MTGFVNQLDSALKLDGYRYSPNSDTLLLHHKKRFGINKQYIFYNYKNTHCKINSLSKEDNPFTRNAARIDNSVDTGPGEVESGGALPSKRVTKRVGWNEPVYCYVFVHFDNVLQSVVVSNANIQTFYPTVDNNDKIKSPYATLIYMTEQDYMNLITESNISKFTLKVTGKDGNTVELPGEWEYKYDNTVQTGGIIIKRPSREKRSVSSCYRFTHKKIKTKRRKTHKKYHRR